MRRERREAEFTQFYLARRLPLRRTAYLIVRDWHTAEDLTQQSMVKLYAAWPRVRHETVDAYARRVVVNECLSHLRRRRDVPVEVLPDRSEGGPEPAVLDVGTALALLPPRQRAIVALRFLDDLSVADVSTSQTSRPTTPHPTRSCAEADGPYAAPGRSRWPVPRGSSWRAHSSCRRCGATGRGLTGSSTQPWQRRSLTTT